VVVRGHADGGCGCLLARGGWVGACIRLARHNQRYAPERTGPCFPRQGVDKHGAPAANPSYSTDLRFYTQGCKESIRHTAQPMNAGGGQTMDVFKTMLHVELDRQSNSSHSHLL
jgi:hypothetical protein